MWSQSLYNHHIHNHFVWPLSSIWFISLNFPLLWPFFLDLQTCSSFLYLEKIFKLLFFIFYTLVSYFVRVLLVHCLHYFTFLSLFNNLLTGCRSHYLSPVQNPQFSSYSAFSEQLWWLVGSLPAWERKTLLISSLDYVNLSLPFSSNLHSPTSFYWLCVIAGK